MTEKKMFHKVVEAEIKTKILGQLKVFKFFFSINLIFLVIFKMGDKLNKISKFRLNSLNY